MTPAAGTAEPRHATVQTKAALEARVDHPNKENRPGGWPMRSPNPLVYDDELAERLYQVSLKSVGLRGSAAS